MPPPTGLLSYLFHHVFLPPKLPQKDDYNSSYENSLLDHVIDTLKRFKALAPSHHHEVLAEVITMITRLREICGSYGEVSERRLKKALQKLDTEGKASSPSHKFSRE